MSDLTDARSPAAILLAKMESARRQMAGKTHRQRQLAAKHLGEAKVLERRLRALEADMEIVSGTRELSVSLLHKEVSGTAYIKGRTWWNGKQREAQIGSIPAVLERLGVASSSGEAVPPAWEDLKQDSELMEDIKTLGREKLRRYIVRRLQRQYLGDSRSQLEADQPEAHDGGLLPRALVAVEPSADWYAAWRSDDLGEEAR